MNLENPVKQELQGTSSSSYSCGIWSAIPQPIEGLNGAHTLPFLNKTYDLVDDPITNHIVSWSRGNNSFVVWDPQSFATNLLPKYFKHNNFSSFVRQLNTYGFRKGDPDKWEFANDVFIRGQRNLLKNLWRKIPQPQISFLGNLDTCLEVGRFSLDLEIDRLRHDKQVLMTELVKLRQHNHSTKCYLKQMEDRIKCTQMKQQHTMNFLATAIQNPSFVDQFAGKRKEIEEARCKKRVRTINQDRRDVLLDGHDNTQFGVLEGISGTSKNSGEECEENMGRHDGGNKALDEGFWAGFLNEGIKEKIDLFGAVEDDDNLNMLTQQFHFLGSTSM